MSFLPVRKLSGSLFVLFLLFGCAGHQKTLQSCYSQAMARNFDGALSSLEKSALAGSKRDRLLYLMEKGMLFHLKGDLRQSNLALEEADRLSEQLFTRSLSAEGASFFTNDAVTAYAGEDFESVYLNYYKALNYLGLCQFEEAAVEARRVDEKLNWFTDTYEGQNVFRESAFLRLLTGLIYEAMEDPNNAFIAYRKSLEAYRAYESKYGVPVPDLLWSRLLTSARNTGFTEEYEEFRQEANRAGIEPTVEDALMAVIVEKGFVPAKKEISTSFPTEHGFPVKLALPGYGDPIGYRGSVEVSLDGEAWKTAEKVEDVGAIARQSLEDKKGRILAKAISRAVVKELAARKAEKELGSLAGLTARMAALMTERADLRSWTSLPSEILLAVIPAEPGSYTVGARKDDGQLAEMVEVSKGRIGLIKIRIF